ncbi:bifunctional phosphopantothenoylcysteine decarboxylase/phosphopantothenate--cysteine ligase CoaBC [Liquorilactobacillus uvarum]|uniref:bifunctional phosphopantothenoylcysteine decarboxylase/phosphopantothenate--cysteine ligase CoaBC n=1 Tax=Liquorilactobacillus uvarum TaxID=303240 RepID=UPI00288C60CA|nr:bifunctional phosphopantothenoylcysteine decarboxylase/phosphopantothenate--cysteine ligase CoaBC [Liquorilactobacillus uvarum]
MKNKHVAVYITGGIAAYKAAYFVRALVKEGAQVKVAMTKAATDFITPMTLKTLSRNRVYTDEMLAYDEIVPHIEIADWSDEAVIIPATANVIAKMAHGLADDFVTSALLASDCPKFVVPAMNEKMLNNEATVRNIECLKSDDINVLEPDVGFLAEGYEGKGRLPATTAILEWINQKSKHAALDDMRGKRVLITAGKTVEAIDPVRYITNHSTGKMGYALAQEAVERGAEVTLISGPTDLPKVPKAKFIPINTTSEMAKEVNRCFEQVDIVVMAAAVSDYRVEKPATQKIKKKSDTLEMKLIKNVDILKGLGRKKEKQILVGFAAETQNLRENAARKMQEKNLDLLIANDVSRRDIGFGSDQNEVLFLRPGHEPFLIGKNDKKKIAQRVFDCIMDF